MVTVIIFIYIDYPLESACIIRNTKVLCFPNDMVSDMKERILQTVAKYPSVQNIVLHTGSNDVSKQKSEVLKQDFTGLIRTVSSMNAAVFISGPIPTIRGGEERFSRLLALNRWLSTTCGETGINFINNFHIFWERKHLFKENGFSLNKSGVDKTPSVSGTRTLLHQSLQ
uniref:SGNH hydrolase-type esterase domain-containing protein n=1 Tax=Oryzias melastigma TaxID=30732 RepID=A0A3B3CVW2_ORYME